MAGNEPENAMDVFFQKYAGNKTKLDAMRTDNNNGGLSGLLVEAPLSLGMNVAEGLTSYGARLGRGAVNGALAWGYDLSAASRLKKGKDGEAAQYAAAADFLRGSSYRSVPGKPSGAKETKTDDGSGGDGKTPGYDAIMKRLDAMEAASRQGSPVYQSPNSPPSPSPVSSQSVQTPQVVGNGSLSKKDARLAAMYYSALAYGMQQ